MMLRQISVSRRSIAVAAALVGMVSLAIAPMPPSTSGRWMRPGCVATSAGQRPPGPPKRSRW